MQYTQFYNSTASGKCQLSVFLEKQICFRQIAPFRIHTYLRNITPGCQWFSTDKILIHFNAFLLRIQKSAISILNKNRFSSLRNRTIYQRQIGLWYQSIFW